MPEKELIFNRLEEKKKLLRIKISEINPGARVRVDFSDSKAKWEEFLTSLKERGQIQPIAVIEYEKVYEGYKYFLLVGGRRFRALKELKQTEINACVYPDNLTAYEIKSIELEENIQRKELSIHELAKAQKNLFETWQAIYGKKTSSSKDAKGISMTDAARKMGTNVMTLSENIRLADMFEVAPDLKDKVKNRAEALTVLKRSKKISETKERVAKLQQEQVNSTSDQIKEKVISAYHLEDFLTGVKKIPDKSIDLINFDPDYPTDTGSAISYPNIQAMKALDCYKEIQDFEGFFKASLKEFNRILKDNTWVVIWFGYEYFQIIQDWVKAERFDITFIHGKWLKNNAHTRNPERYLGHKQEPFFYARKGKAQIQKPHDDTFTHPADAPGSKINPYQKPITLMMDIYRTFLLPGSRIVSPCIGSGNDILAAFNTNNVCIGFDVSKEQKEGFKLKVLEQEFKHYE